MGCAQRWPHLVIECNPGVKLCYVRSAAANRRAPRLTEVGGLATAASAAKLRFRNRLANPPFATAARLPTFETNNPASRRDTTVDGPSMDD